MQWESLSEFFAMGGYGLYVWVSFGATAFCMIGEVLMLHVRHAALTHGEGTGSAGVPSR